MSVSFFPILLILLAVIMLIGLAKTKRKFGFFQFLIFLIVAAILTGSWGMLLAKPWASKLINISLGAFVLFVLIPALGRLLGVAMFTKLFYKGMEKEENDNRD